jgi:hypothetical protein
MPRRFEHHQYLRGTAVLRAGCVRSPDGDPAADRASNERARVKSDADTTTGDSDAATSDTNAAATDTDAPTADAYAATADAHAATDA